MTLNKQALRMRYSPQPVPKCHICGAEMTVQRISASRITYGCTGATYDDAGYHYAEGRSIADYHYEQSRFIVVDVSDPDVLALLDENARLTDERNALRETMGGDNTRAAADIYFQLVEECEIPPGGSLVGHVDCMRDDLASAERRIAELEASTITVTLPMPYDINVAGERIDWDKGDHFDRDEVIEALHAADIKIKGE